MVLSRNFRSGGEVLEAANFVFSDIMSREMGEMDYTDAGEAVLRRGRTIPQQRDWETELHVVSVEDTTGTQAPGPHEAEARLVAARRIRQLLDEKFPVQAEGAQLRPGTAGGHRYPHAVAPARGCSTFTRALAREGIPCGSGESEDFFSTMEIAVTVSLLEIVDNPRQDVPLIGGTALAAGGVVSQISWRPSAPC